MKKIIFILFIMLLIINFSCSKKVDNPTAPDKSAMPTNTSIIIDTLTATPTLTNYPTFTSTATFTYSQTEIETSTFTETSTPTETFTYTLTPTETATLTNSQTPTETPTSTDSLTPTETFTHTNSPTPITTFEKTFGGIDNDHGYSVVETSDGGFVITGSTYSSGGGGADVYLIKTDSYGNFEWQKTFGGVNDDNGQSVVQTTDGGFIIVGTTNSFGIGYSDIYLIKTDSEGNYIWQKTFGGTNFDYGYSVQQTVAGGFIIAGAIGNNVGLIKTDSDGNFEWQNIFGGVFFEIGFSVQQTNDNGFIIVGETDSFGAGLTDVYMIKTDSYGNYQWHKTFGGKFPDFGKSVQQTSDNGYIITGTTNSFGSGNYDVYLIKTDSEGNLIWQKTFGGLYDDYGQSVKQTTDGGFIITGAISSDYGAANFDLYLVKTDSEGNLIWQKTFGGPSMDFGYSVQQTSDSGFIIAGEISRSGSGFDVYLIKTY